MSNYGRRQLLANEKAFKYQFNLEILKFKCEFPLKTSIKFMWKRNNKSIQTKSLLDVPTGKQEITVNEKLSSISTIIFNTQKKQFMGKESELIVNMYFGGSPKKLASCHIDMKNILDPNNYKANRCQTFEIPMGLHVKNTINDSKILFRLSSIYKEEIILSDKSIGTASLNMSGLSIPQDHKYYEKRYDVIPSKDNKDTHSVNSYNPVNRYPSASKRERDDSSSIRKHQYGYFNNTLKNNSSSNNDYQTKSALKSIDNKTDMNQGTSQNKLLIEQQTKRSKAEAELTKNKIQIDSLKKKLNEFMIQNIQFKEQVGLLNQQNQHSVSKQQVNILQQKLYEAGNDLRSIKNQLQSEKYERNKMQNQFSKLKNERMNMESQLQSKQRKIDDLQRNQINLKIVQNMQNEKSTLKLQLDSIKKYLEEYKKQAAQKQNRFLIQKSRQIHELTGKIELLRKENDKSKINQSNSEVYYKKYMDMQVEYKNQMEQLTSKTKRNVELQKEIEECHNRLVRYQSEKYSIQYQLKKIKEESVDRGEYQTQKHQLLVKCENLQFENKRFVEELLKNKQTLEHNGQQIEQNRQALDNKQKSMAKIQQEKNLQQGKIKNLLSQINELQRKNNDKDLQLSVLIQNAKRFQAQRNTLKDRIQTINTQKTIPNTSNENNAQADILFRQNLQLKIQIKFAYDELNRLKMIQEELNEEKYMSQRNRQEKESIELQYEKLQKELKNKNLALLIEHSKITMMSEEAHHYIHTIQQLKNQLDNTKIIINNGQQQLNQLQAYILQHQSINKILQTQNTQIKNTNTYLNQQVNTLKKGQAELSSINTQINNYNNQLKNQNRQLHSNSQTKLKQMQQRNNQKLHSLELMNKNINTANDEIKQLQKLNEQRQEKLFQKDRIIVQLQNRCKEIQSSKMVNESEYNKLINDKKILEKRNEMIMEEIHFMKKKYEEEKGRSLSTTRNEENNRLRGMEMELQKKEKNISKLNKEKLEMEEQNVKLNILNMKYLNQIQKFKTNPNGTTYSFKSMSTAPK